MQTSNWQSISLYLIIGGITAAIYYGLISILWGLLATHYLLAISIAYVAAVAFHFLANRYITFEALHDNITKQFSKYAAMAVFNYFVTLLIVDFVVRVAALHLYIGIVLATLTTMLIGYTGMKRWIFARTQD